MEIHNKKFNRKIYKIVKEEALNDLMVYLDENDFDDDLEIPIYFMELEQCKTKEEIHQYMREFGWKNKMVIRTLNNDIINLNLKSN